MNDRLNLFSIIISSVVASITIVIAIFAWTYVLQVLAKSGLYGVGDVDAISFFASSNFANIGYESMLAIAGLIMSKSIIISLFVIVFFCFFMQLVLFVLDSAKNINKSSKLYKFFEWVLTNCGMSIIIGALFGIIFCIIIIVFLGSAYTISVIQESIVNKGNNSSYCNVLINKDSESQVLRVNLDSNYKLSWTYYGLIKTTLNNTDAYYPNKLDSKKRDELINRYCK